MPDVSDVTFTGPLDSITDAEVLDVDVSDDDDALAARAQERDQADDKDKEPTPDPARLERSIRRRRRELISHMNELERVVRAKLDVRTRLRHGAREAAERARYALEHVMVRVRERPLPYLVLGGVMVWMLFGRRRSYRY
jgi:ABC-type histidine transport system ATPase subunit